MGFVGLELDIEAAIAHTDPSPPSHGFQRTAK